MVITKDTQICISVSSHPSNTGTTLHNACYEAQGLDFIYKAFQVTELEPVVGGLRALGIRGCSVSMPFKKKILEFIDEVEPLAKRVGAVNTVLNDHGRLTGYNTDVSGALKSISTLGISVKHSVLIAGAGGMARALVVAFQDLGYKNLSVFSRTPDAALTLANEFSIAHLQCDAAKQTSADVLVNATPVGMAGHPQGPIFTTECIENCHTVIDVVASLRATPLISEAKSRSKVVLTGLELSKGQMIDQYEIYTGVKPPQDVLEAVFRKLADG